MANVIHGPFVKGASTATGSYGTGVGQSNTYTSGNANNDETQAGVALASFNPDLVSAGFILSGVSCVKDVTTATQLNITSGAAYLVMTDGTTARIDVSATTESTTGHPSATLLLDLNPDGSWSFATTHSAQANYLPICAVTTDGSANISGVTDKRIMYVSQFPRAAHTAFVQPGGSVMPAPLAPLLTQQANLAATISASGVTLSQAGALRGSMDTAALFDGATGYLSAPTTGLPTSANAPLSLECWYKQSAAPANTQTPVALGNPGVNGAEFYIAFATSTAPWAGNGTTNSNSAGATTTNVWHHVVASFDGTNIRVYVDGALASGPTAASITLAYGGLFIGQLGNSSDWFAGSIDEVAVYTTALSATQVSNHYNAGISTTSDSYAATVLADAPARYYRLGDLPGLSAANTIPPTITQLLDAAGNLSAPGYAQIGGNATISGAATVAGPLASVGAQGSAGSFGVPVIVAQALDVHITTTSSTQVISYTPTVNGIYEICATFTPGINSSHITLSLLWSSQHGSGSPGSWFATNDNGGTTPLILLNAAGIFSGNYSTFPQVIQASTAGAISVHYLNSTATPNDFASVIIKRLA